MKDDKIKIVEVEISKLILAPYNPRKISPAQMEKLKKSIQAFSFCEPVVINKDYTVIGGNMRTTAYKEMGYKTIPCVIVELDKQNEKALNIALNKTGGDWDYEALQDLLSELKIADFDIELTGFNLDTQLQNTDFTRPG